MERQRSSTHDVLSLARLRVVTTIAVVAVGIAPSYAGAQCAFDRPTVNGSGSTGKFYSSLVQAFVGCGDIGGSTPNTTALGSVPACQPPETFNQLAGSPASGWRFFQVPGKSKGKVRIKRVPGGTNLEGYPPVLRDIGIRLQLRHIVDTDGHGAAKGTGRLVMILRATFNDYDTGDVTAVDMPVDVAVPMVGGKADVDTILGADYLNGVVGVPRLPDCASVEILWLAVLDANGNIFAVPGVRL